MAGAQATATASVSRRSRRLGRAIFGDRRGLALFLGTLCAVALYWRGGVFITDTSTLVVTLESLADGRLWLTPATGSHFAAPGAVVSDGYVYGRNYGQVALSLPILWGLEALASVADLRVALTALWHLALLAFVGQVATLRRVRQSVTAVGCGFVLASFLLNLAVASQFGEVSRALLALQVVSMLATALLAVVTYRLVTRRYGPWLGTAVGAATVLVLPVGFWANLPKRHVFVALLLVGILYAVDRSRTDDVAVALPYLGDVPGFRALAYALVGAMAWIHAGEAVFVFLALLAVDLPTAPNNDARTLTLLGGVLCLSMAPTFLTNVLTGGNPLLPPRLLEPARGVDETVLESGGVTGPRSVSSTSYGDVVDFSFLPRPLAYLASVVVGGLYGLTQFDRLYHTWIRSGPVQLIEGGRAAFAGANLTVLESVPLFGAFVALVAGRLRAGASSVRRLLGNPAPVDALAVAFTAVFVLMYTLRLPVHVQITVRYLLPTYPLLLFLLVRTSRVRQVLVGSRRLAVWTYAGGVLVGTQLLLAVVALRDVPVAGAIQTHAWVGLGLAALLAATLLASQFDERARPAAAVSIGLAAAAGTAFLLLSGLSYFSFVGEFVLPVAEVVAEVVGRV